MRLTITDARQLLGSRSRQRTHPRDTKGACGMLGCSLVLSLITGCGGGVAPLDPRDPSLPPQTRQWLAAAQDGVMAARARRDSNAAELTFVRDWADRMDDEVELAGSASARLEALADARVELAEIELEIAERGVTFAEAKLDLAYAERAVHHDLGSYDLEPLRQNVESAREQIDEARRRALTASQQVLEANRVWWSTYAQLAAGGGDTRTFWIGDREPITQVIAGTRAAEANAEAEGDEETEGEEETEGDEETERDGGAAEDEQ